MSPDRSEVPVHRGVIPPIDVVLKTSPVVLDLQLSCLQYEEISRQGEGILRRCGPRAHRREQDRREEYCTSASQCEHRTLPGGLTADVWTNLRAFHMTHKSSSEPVPRSLKCVKLLLICAGTIAPQNEARSSAGLGAIDAGTNVQAPADRPLQAPPNVQLDGVTQSAPELFRLGRFAEAEPQFAWIAAVRRGTSWGERAQYHLAECQYQQKKYCAALSSFERLHTEYPATGYIDNLVRREYEIARLWMTQVDQHTPADKKLPWFARLDGRLPLFGTRKFALEALEHVRHNDPAGPLADDAAVKIADHYMKRREYDTAAQYYAQVAAEYPKSPLCLYARLAALHARIRSCFEF